MPRDVERRLSEIEDDVGQLRVDLVGVEDRIEDLQASVRRLGYWSKSYGWLTVAWVGVIVILFIGRNFLDRIF